MKVETGEHVASARSVQVSFDYETQKPVAIPEELRRKLEEAQAIAR